MLFNFFLKWLSQELCLICENQIVWLSIISFEAICCVWTQEFFKFINLSSFYSFSYIYTYIISYGSIFDLRNEQNHLCSLGLEQFDLWETNTGISSIFKVIFKFIHIYLLFIFIFFENYLRKYVWFVIDELYCNFHSLGTEQFDLCERWILLIRFILKLISFFYFLFVFKLLKYFWFVRNKQCD